MATYPDIEGHLFEQDIEDLYERGLVGVTPGENYRPDDPITRGESAAYFNRVLKKYFPMHEVPEPPPVEPPVEPPEGMYIPKLQGPILTHDGNPTIVKGFRQDQDVVKLLRNVKIEGKIYVTKGTVIVEDFEWDGQGGNVCAHTGGGKIILRRGVLYNAEDGIKNNVDGEQIVVHNLHHPPGGHMDCVQHEGSADSTFKWSYFDSKTGSNLGNAAFMLKTDFSPSQRCIVEDSYINGGNYTVKTNDGNNNPGKYPHAEFHRCIWGGDARYGSHAGPIAVWDVME